jgi:hypothetical protein
LLKNISAEDNTLLITDARKHSMRKKINETGKALHLSRAICEALYVSHHYILKNKRA